MQSTTPIVWAATMKKELVPVVKVMSRKQRMFMIMPVHAVVLHKRYFSKQSKRLRNFAEIAHGYTFFWGGVDRVAEDLSGGSVDSEDDYFWDKRFLVMEDVYDLRCRALFMSANLSPYERREVALIVSSMVDSYVLLPTGDCVLVKGRMNPSGADATTENNCVGRKIIENYCRLKHLQSLGEPLPRELPNCRGVRYMGDDRVACMSEFPPGYSAFYRECVATCGVQIKTLVTTDGPEGAEFCGFVFRRKWWGAKGYMPVFNLDRLYGGLFIPNDDGDLSIGFTRMMSFSLLLFPHKGVFERLKPLVISFCQKFPELELARITIDWWSDPVFLARMWDGQEGSAPFKQTLRNDVQSYLEEEGYDKFTVLNGRC